MRALGLNVVCVRQGAREIESCVEVPFLRRAIITVVVIVLVRCLCVSWVGGGRVCVQGLGAVRRDVLRGRRCTGGPESVLAQQH